MGCDFSRIQAAAGESDRPTQISDLCILNVKMPFFPALTTGVVQ